MVRAQARVMAFTPDRQGRGAWTRTGGLLSDNGTGAYYRLNKIGEPPVGSTWAQGVDKSDAARAVNAGTQALQALCGLSGADADGWYGQQTDKAVRTAQARVGVIVDGIVGARTMRGLLTPLITKAASDNGIPLRYLGGVFTHESLLDPAAVGYSTPDDHGLPQINLAAFGVGSTEYIAYEQAMDPSFSVPWTAKRLRAKYDEWVGKTSADPWEVAILNHNSPYNALRLARSGAYPTGQSQQYVSAVLAAW